RWCGPRDRAGCRTDRAGKLRTIVLDTNVVSEPTKPNGNPAVRTWLDQQVAETSFFTATSLSELLVGVEILPEGRRQAGLGAALAELVPQLFASRMLTFDWHAAKVYVQVVSQAREVGHNISVADAQIA